MVFSSLIFLYAFLPLSVLLYFLLPGIRLKNGVLLLFSLLFYAWGEPVYVLLMLLSIGVNYFLGRLMEDDPAHKKHTLVFSLIWNLFVLGFFKYYAFLLINLNALFGTDFPVRELPLPIGISFYTFQTLSYLIDLYRGKFRAQRSILDFGLYITMYFQLIAGPIVRYEDVEKQLQSREISLTRLGEGLGRFSIGLGKKVLIANMLGSLYSEAEALGAAASTASAWLGALACTLQIYFDFSGYSDMAIGLGHGFGFDFPENFGTPYLSRSVTEFWRRWHISLGTWFREYVYIPLGGNRGGTAKHIRNILLVWLLTGLWHGAAWNFVAWGVYYGLLLLVEKYLFRRGSLPPVLNHLATLLMVVIGWVIFFANSLPQAWTSILTMFGLAGTGLTDAAFFWLIREYGAWLALGAFFCLPFMIRLRDYLLKEGRFLLPFVTLGILLLSTAFLVTENYNPFLYFRF